MLTSLELSTTVITAAERHVLGIVSSESVQGISIQKDNFAAIFNFFGGRVKSYEKDLATARNQVLNELISKAQKLGATGIDGIMFSYFGIDAGKSPFLGVACWGTAIKHTRSSSNSLISAKEHFEVTESEIKGLEPSGFVPSGGRLV